MRSALVFFMIFALPLKAEPWAFKSFRARKVHLQKQHHERIESGEPLLLLADQACLHEQRLSGKKGADPLLALGIEVDHKAPANMRYAALNAKLAGPLTAAGLESLLAGQPCILGASGNPEVRTASVNDPLFPNQPALPAISQIEGERFFFHPLWGIRREVVLAVVDSGAHLAHPDLASRLYRLPDGSPGYDFANGDNDPSDDFGHGTHVAGIALAQKDNGVGIRGVMGEWSRLMPVKSQDETGGGTMADVINAFRWAVDNGAEVVNLSLASRQQNQALVDALEYALSKKVTVVVASGNDGEQITAGNLITPVGYAGNYEGVIGVGSIDADSKSRSTFSNYGPDYVEIAGPGSPGSLAGILSTYLNGQYIGNNGTSMAAPHVSGAAGLVTGFYKTHSIAYTPAAVEQAILISADRNAANQAFFQEGRSLNLENLGRYIFNSTFVDSTGGFDEP